MKTTASRIIDKLNNCKHIDIGDKKNIRNMPKAELRECIDMLLKKSYVVCIRSNIYVKITDFDIPYSALDIPSKYGWYCYVKKDGRFYNDVLMPLINKGNFINPNNVTLV